MGRIVSRVLWLAFWLLCLAGLFFWALPQVTDRLDRAEPSVPTVAKPKPGTFTWIDDSTGLDPPSAWPCEPIHYTIVTRHNPPGAAALIGSVFRDTQRRSGGLFKFVRDADRLDWNGDYPVKGIAVGWDSERWSWGGDPLTVAGRGGPGPFRVGGAYEKGMARLRLSMIPGVNEEARTALTHEIGHALGLGHVAKGSPSIMTAQWTRPPRTRFSRTDMIALKWAAAWSCKQHYGIFGPPLGDTTLIPPQSVHGKP
jgi:hypothetical protein